MMRCYYTVMMIYVILKYIHCYRFLEFATLLNLEHQISAVHVLHHEV